jgi:hypothetical protein
MPLLMAGGAYLCFEGMEKLAHRLLHGPQEDEAHLQALARAMADPKVDLVALEKDKIKGAVRTDFILSAEIITIALGAVADAEIGVRLGVLAGVALLMTIGVYGLVAGIVKLDDLGLWMSRRRGALVQRLGHGLLRAAPWLMKTLSVAGSVAMFLVVGGILAHGLPALHHAVQALAQASPAAGWLVPAAANLGVGLAAGALVLAAVTLFQRVARRA